MPRYRDLFGYTIYYWSNEGKPLEPIHFHVAKNLTAKATKVWIKRDGTLEVAYKSSDIKEKELKRILKIMELYIDDYIREWEQFFGEKVKYYN